MLESLPQVRHDGLDHDSVVMPELEVTPRIEGLHDVANMNVEPALRDGVE